MKSLAIEAAKIAGCILLDNAHKVQNTEIGVKGKSDFVTYVDRLSEETITKLILENFPSHDILGEESGVRGSNDEYCWIIDPLDGTTNYIHGYPHFGVSIALRKGDDLILGVVYDPTVEELFVAEKDKGAYLNGNKIKVSERTDIGDSLLMTGFPSRYLEYIEAYIESFRQFSIEAVTVRRSGAAALDFCYVACGRCDGFWEIGLGPWDMAAGGLIVREAGGKVTDFFDDEHYMRDNDAVASNGGIHKAMIAVLSNIFSPDGKRQTVPY